MFFRHTAFWTSSSSSVNLQSGLLLHYKMNDNAANNTITDSTANGLDAGYYYYDFDPDESAYNTSSGTRTGKINSALDFDSYYYAYTSPDSSLEGLSAFTVAAWVYRDNDTPLTQYIVQCRDRLGLAAAADGEDGYWVYVVDDSATPNYIDQNVGTSPCPTTSWTHVMLIADGSNVMLYEDNSQVGSSISLSGNYDLVDSSKTDRPLYIGRAWWNVANTSLDGAIDDFRIYNKALSSAERAALYNSGSGTES